MADHDSNKSSDEEETFLEDEIDQTHENDNCHEPLLQTFQQEKYYWLFNEEMGFQKRKGLRYEQSLNPGEYAKMRKINRIALCRFLEEMKDKCNSAKNQSINPDLQKSLGFLQEHIFIQEAENFGSA